MQLCDFGGHVLQCFGTHGTDVGCFQYTYGVTIARASVLHLISVESTHAHAASLGYPKYYSPNKPPPLIEDNVFFESEQVVRSSPRVCSEYA